MDLIKIGKYIAGKRKGLGMTQRQLADKLGMSDKSVSKWERGICLPDVSVYSELCQILGISINEFLAGEDIAQETIIQKSEENIIGVVTDGKYKQKRLKVMICILSSILFLAIVSAIGIAVYRANEPQNIIAPVDRNSIEMKTLELLAGPDLAYMYKFTTTDDYNRLTLHISEYHSGNLINTENIELGFAGMESPENGEILIVPDFDNYIVKIIASTEVSKISTELPILANVADREYYGRSATEISETTNVRYNEEQSLMALIYDNDVMSVPDIYNLISAQTDFLAENDYVYYFSFEFCKE